MLIISEKKVLRIRTYSNARKMLGLFLKSGNVDFQVYTVIIFYGKINTVTM